MIGGPFLERLVEGSRQHAARRVDEMEAARDLLARARGRAPDRVRERGAARRARGARAGSAVVTAHGRSGDHAERPRA